LSKPKPNTDFWDKGARFSFSQLLFIVLILIKRCHGNDIHTKCTTITLILLSLLFVMK